MNNCLAKSRNVYYMYLQQWNLLIKPVSLEDNGLYECQATTHPPQSIIIKLLVAGTLLKNMLRYLSSFIRYLINEEMRRALIMHEEVIFDFAPPILSKFP